MKTREHGNRLEGCGSNAWPRFRHLKHGTRLALAAVVLTGGTVVATQPPTATAAASCANLAACYNNVGISADNESSRANFDGDGNSYAASALADAATNKAGPGAPISSQIRFTFPQYGKDANGTAKNDNLVPQGQTIALPPTAGATKLGFLLSASWGSRSEDVKINYTDRTVKNFELHAPDWQSPGGGTVAINSAYRNTPGDNKEFVHTYIYSQTVDVDPAKTVESVTLPAGGPPDHGKATMHIFDIATGNAVTVSNPGNQSTRAGTPVNLQIQASDSAPRQDLTYSASGLPSGLSVDAKTGRISGTPTSGGTSTVTVTATDTTGSSGSATFTWTVVAPTCRVTAKQVQYHKPVLGYYFYLVDLSITNNGASAIPGRWNLKFTFNEERGIVRNPDGYVISPTTGKNMTVTENKGVAINPRSTVDVGILTYHYSTSPKPSPLANFELNGERCAS